MTQNGTDDVTNSTDLSVLPKALVVTTLPNYISIMFTLCYRTLTFAVLN